MFVFIKQANDILDSLGASQEDPRGETQEMHDEFAGMSPEEIFGAGMQTGKDQGGSDLETFKDFVMQYMQEHDELPSDHPAMGQIANTSALDEIEAFLRGNLDYCDDCMLKLYRRYASGNKQPEDCPCE